jgi:hypothetical protein
MAQLAAPTIAATTKKGTDFIRYRIERLLSPAMTKASWPDIL